MNKRFFFALLTSGTALFLLCGPSQSPYTNTADAKIIKENSLRSLDARSDSLKVFTAVKCTVELYLPKLIDSFYVHLSRSGSDSIIASGAVTGASFDFPLSVSVPGVYDLTVVIVKTDKSTDTLVKNNTVYAMVPVVVPDAPSHTIYLPVDSFTIMFTVTDPDSNVWKAFTWLDTAAGVMQETSFAPKTHSSVISRTIKGDALLAALNAPIVCHAAAVDFPDSNVSEVAVCTLHVLDTTTPAIRLLSYQDTITAITALPDTITALITDIAGISTAAFNTGAMTLISDTAVFILSSLDTGTHIDSIVAIDNRGNKGRLLFSLTYHGKQLYPPHLKDLSRATTETSPFAPLTLDNCVTIEDPAIIDKAAFIRDSLLWEIRDSMGTILNYNLAPPHTFTLPAPADTEWTGTLKFTFKVWVRNNASLYDVKQFSFFITEVPDPPVITLSSQVACGTTASFDTIDLDTVTTVRDPDNALSTLQWSFANGKHFKVDSIEQCTKIGVPPLIRFICKFTRRIAIVPLTLADSTWTGADTITFTVTDPAPSSRTTVKKIPFSRWTLCHILPTLPKKTPGQ
jgi:hypothetical protein